jgi:hypothetical protein
LVCQKSKLPGPLKVVCLFHHNGLSGLVGAGNDHAMRV